MVSSSLKKMGNSFLGLNLFGAGGAAGPANELKRSSPSKLISPSKYES